MPTAPENVDVHTGTTDPDYNLILTLQQALEDAYRFECFTEDARRAGDDELVDLFDELATQDRELAERLKGILSKRLHPADAG